MCKMYLFDAEIRFVTLTKAFLHFKRGYKIKYVISSLNQRRPLSLAVNTGVFLRLLSCVLSL